MRRRYLQFSMGSLLAVVTVAALFSYWLGNTSKSAREQKSAIAQVEKSEGIVQFAEVPVPEWLKNAVGEDYFRSARVVDFATRHGRKRDSNEPKATDEKLKELASLTDVETLELGNSEAVTDDGLIHLKPLKKLSTLYLYRTGVKGPGLVHISQLPSLKAISLNHCDLDDSALKHLGKMPHLTSAMLAHTNVTDAGIPDLLGAASLETLTLRNTGISDIGLKQLEHLTRLESLDVVGTDVTVEGVEHFKRALPDCRVAVTFGLGVTATEELLFPEGYRPSASEVNSRLKELKIDGEVEVSTSEPDYPIVSLRLFDYTLSDKVVLSLIEHMPKLEVLNIRRGLVGDDLLVGIGGKPIRYLSLQSTRVTDAGMQHLSALRLLNELILSETDITDAGLVHLRGLKNLSSVMLNHTRTTPAGVRKLRKELPNW